MKFLIFSILASVFVVVSAEVKIIAQPRHLIISEQEKNGEIVFSPLINGRPMRKTSVNVYEIRKDESSRMHYVLSGNDGKVVFKFEIKESPQVVIAAIPGEDAAAVYVELISPEEWKRNSSEAAKIKLNKNLRILFLSDSLSDFNRGYNFSEKLNFWVNLYNPGKSSFRNASVAGDFITRVWQRMEGIEGTRKEYRQEMYDALFDEKPDLVFILLGQNDSRTSSKDGHVSPLVTPELQEKTYRDLIKLIQNKIGGKIVLVSSTSSNYDLTKDNVERATKKRPDAVHVIFGPPKHMEAFNDVLIKLSKELGLDYLDIYQPMKARKDKASLLSDVDGVHLTEKGHSFIAFEFLKYIASQQK